jgi:DHA1 family tetracycline resistance protein-like MFS transporter
MSNTVGDGAPNPPAPRKAALAFIFITVFLDMLTFGILIPVLPLLVSEMAGGTAANQAHMFGWFMFVWAACQFFASPILCALSDQIGRRPIVLWSNFGVGLQYLILALAPSLVVMLAARIVSGVASASVPTANAYVADVTPPEKRAAAFGIMGAAFSAGFIIGPAIGGNLSAIDIRLPLFVAAGMSMLNFCYGLFILPESLPKAQRKPFSWQRANPLAAVAFLAGKPDLGKLASMHFLAQFAHVVFPSVFVLYAASRFGYSSATIGNLMAVVGVLGLCVQAGLVGRVVKAVGERRALLFGLSAGTLSFICYGVASGLGVLILAVVLGALLGFAGPAGQSLMTQRVSPIEQGQLQGALQSIVSIGSVFGPLIYIFVFGYFISPQAGAYWPGAPFLLSAALSGAALLVAHSATRTVEKRPA